MTNSRVLPLRFACWTWFAGCGLLPGAGLAEVTPQWTNAPALRRLAEREFATARAADLTASGTNLLVAIQLAAACFQLAEFSTNAAERAALADLGIATSRAALAHSPTSAAAHLQLALNLGQMARTRTVSGLSIVNEMERAFLRARALDPLLQQAAPDRYLGLLYREAPPLISVGDRVKARRHLLRAAELAPEFPPNHLNLIDSFLLWGQRAEARRQLRKLEAQLPRARTQFAGEAWVIAWADWEPRLARARTRLRE